MEESVFTKNLVLPGRNASLSNHVKEKSDVQNILTIGVMYMLRRVMKQTQPWQRNTAWSGIDFGFQAKLFDFSHDSHRVIEKYIFLRVFVLNHDKQPKIMKALVEAGGYHTKY